VHVKVSASDVGACALCTMNWEAFSYSAALFRSSCLVPFSNDSAVGCWSTQLNWPHTLCRFHMHNSRSFQWH